MERRILRINPDTEVEIDANMVEGYNAMFKSSPGQLGINGCPMGRGKTVKEALADLKYRTEIESPVVIVYSQSHEELLTLFWQGWCETEGLPLMSAEDLLCSFDVILTDEQVEVVNAFTLIWDAVV